MGHCSWSAIFSTGTYTRGRSKRFEGQTESGKFSLLDRNCRFFTMNTILLEVCIELADDAVIAVEAGAHRLEINAALLLGGVTPSLGFADPNPPRARGVVSVVTLLRDGDFCYSELEFDVMRRDTDLLLQHGASGVAFGLRPATAASIMIAAGGLSSTSAPGLMQRKGPYSTALLISSPSLWRPSTSWRNSASPAS